MSSHAEGIWLAWLANKPTQYRERYSPKNWCDCAPVDMPVENQPQSCPELWRVKPERITYYRWARMYLNLSGNIPMIIYDVTEDAPWPKKSTEKDIESKNFFGGWLTDWVQYDTVEEITK